MDLFVYGTLRHRPLFDAVAGPPGAVAPQVESVTLADHAVQRVDHSTLPMLRIQPGGVATGDLWSGLTAAQRARLDLYEVAFGYDLRTVSVTLPGGAAAPALAYFPPADQQTSGDPWTLDAWQATEAQAALLAAQEIDSHDPPLSGAELFRQWSMIQGRAEAKVRAGQGQEPATVRYAATPAHFSVDLRAPLTGGFFKLAQLFVNHRTFEGSQSGPLLREVLVGCDAALVLPYDAARDRVLMVEQFRTGPATRHDPNPWSLEPVAGIIDPGETPEDAALREAGEEAALSLTGLEKMFSIYASPGSNTDHFYCFLGHADLPSLQIGFGGLAEEAEDLRLHVLPFEDALALIDTGEINAGPMVAMLLWLARRRSMSQKLATSGK